VVLDKVVSELWDLSLNKSTRNVYEAGFRAFKKFSDLYLFRSMCHTYPPVSEEILIYFVAHCFHFLHVKYSTIKTYLAGIRFAYIKAGFQDPCCFQNGLPYQRLKNILKAVKKSQDNVVKPRLPITAEILRKICNALRLGVFGPYEDLVLETAFCLAFWGFLRCGEFTNQSRTFDHNTDLTIGDIQMNMNDRFFTLLLKRSKTDPFRKGITIKYFATDHDICPVHVMQSLLHTRNDMLAQSQDPLFTTRTGAPLTRSFVIDKLKILLLHLGYNPTLYSGHSFRIGAATTAADAHIPDHMIRTMGRWNSDCYCRYIQTSPKALQEAQQTMALNF